MEPHDQDAQEFASVMEAPDSISAAVARGLLESEGIPVMVQSFQIPWYDGIMTAGAGAWGRILVPAHLAEAATQILEAYFSQAVEDAAAVEDQAREDPAS